MDEVWIDIIGYEKMYAVSNIGRVYSKSQNRYMKFKRVRKYNRVHLFDGNGNSKSMLVHRLVAAAFIPNPLNYPEVNHKNKIEDDNRASNLEWVSAKENTRHKLTHSYKEWSYLIKEQINRLIPV